MNLLDEDFSGDRAAADTVKRWRKCLETKRSLSQHDQELLSVSPELASQLWGLDGKGGSWIGVIRYWRHQFLQSVKTDDYIANPENMKLALDEIFSAMGRAYSLDTIQGRHCWVMKILEFDSSERIAKSDAIKNLTNDLKKIRGRWQDSSLSDDKRRSVYDAMTKRLTDLIYLMYEQLGRNL